MYVIQWSFVLLLYILYESMVGSHDDDEFDNYEDAETDRRDLEMMQA